MYVNSPVVQCPSLKLQSDTRVLSHVTGLGKLCLQEGPVPEKSDNDSSEAVIPLVCSIYF